MTKDLALQTVILRRGKTDFHGNILYCLTMIMLYILCRASSLSPLLPFAFCLLPFAFCLLPFAFLLLPFAFLLLPFAFLLFTFYFCL